MKAMTNIGNVLKSRDIILSIKVFYQQKLWFVQQSCTSVSVVSQGDWAFKTWCFWIMVLEKSLESPLDCKEIKPVHPKGDQSWVFIGRTDAEVEAPILWPPDAKNWFIGKDPDAGQDWRQEEKRTTEDEIVGWHHRLDGHEFEQAAELGDGQGSLVCCSPWGRKESDTTERLNWIVPGVESLLVGRPVNLSSLRTSFLWEKEF